MFEKKGIQVYLKCDGEIMEEYSVTSQGSNFVSSYIQSAAGKNFSVHAKNSTKSFVTAECHMDGRYMNGVLCAAGDEESCRGVLLSTTSGRLFMFAPIVVTDDEKFANARDAVSWQRLGITEIRVQRVRKPRPSASSERVKCEPFWSSWKENHVHEQSNKCGAHCVAHVQCETPRRRMRSNGSFSLLLHASRHVTGSRHHRRHTFLDPCGSPRKLVAEEAHLAYPTEESTSKRKHLDDSGHTDDQPLKEEDVPDVDVKQLNGDDELASMKRLLRSLQTKINRMEDAGQLLRTTS